MTMIDKRSLRAAQAMQEFANNYGFRVEDVLNEEDWSVRLMNGRPEVALNRNGVRAIATLAPNPEYAHRMVDGLFARADELKGREQ